MDATELRSLLEQKGLSSELATEISEVVSDATQAPTSMAAAGLSRAVDEATENLGSDDVGQRYEDRGFLGRGGMGEVRRVFDRRLNRELAMKTLRPDVSAVEGVRARFFEEAQVTAQLQHPSIIPLHDFGRLPDGRLFFTMKEVKGRTLTGVIEEVHATSAEPEAVAEMAPDNGWRSTPSGWTLRRLLDAFRRVCDAVAYAHARGVLHRDLKPHNVMVGDFGEVLVLDWGLTRAGRVAATDSGAAPVLTARAWRADALTTYGTVTGTPAYMAPEQAGGDPEGVGPASDIYSLGATLYHVLSGHAPYADDKDGLFLRPAPTLPERAGGLSSGPVLPAELRQLCASAMAWTPADRPASASELARAIAAWLDGAQRRARAMTLIQEAGALSPELAERRQRAEQLRSRAEDLLQQIPPFAPVEAKLAGWQLQDDARRLAAETAALQTKRVQLLRGALTHAHDLEAAHVMLAETFQQLHAAAETRRDIEEAAALEPLLREHDRGRWRDYLEGDGHVDLVTTPAGATLRLFQMVESRRVMVPRLFKELGTSPVSGVRLPMGRYLVVASLDGHHDVRYPVFIDRQHHWSGIPTGATAPRAIQLPPLGALGPEDCYVPAGWFWSGGDPAANNSLAAKRLWLDGFVMRRFPVTIEEFLAFLNDLARRGALDEARMHAPEPPAWEKGPARHEHGVILGEDGRFTFPGSPEQLRWPVVLVNWAGAAAYAAWLAEREATPWRLASEMEHEKAARGVDGSPFPWGHHFDATFCKMRHSTAGEGRNVRASVDDFPVDESIYGIRGLAGNVHSWCIDPYQPRGPRLLDDVPQISDGSDVRGPGAGGVHRILRGGSWRDPEASVRAAFRDSPPAVYRDTAIGFRVSRPFPIAEV